MKERLLNIINAGANRVSKDDRVFIKYCATELCQEVPAGTCKNCYVDTAVILVQKLEEQEKFANSEMNLTAFLIEQDNEPEATEVEESEKKERKILIKKGVDLLVNGVRVNRYTVTTDEQAEKLTKILDKKYFEFVK